MLLQEKLNHILPPIDGIYAHITSEFGTPRPNGKIHQGVDFNYIGGQTGLNLTHPKLYSPVEGRVTFVGGNFGTIKIKDAQGMSHELLHTHRQLVKVGETVKIGDELATMGGKGPLGYYQYPQHVHYQIKNALGYCENPEKVWEKQISIENCIENLVELKIKGQISYQDVLFESPKVKGAESAIGAIDPIGPVSSIVLEDNSLLAFDVPLSTLLVL